MPVAGGADATMAVGTLLAIGATVDVGNVVETERDVEDVREEAYVVGTYEAAEEVSEERAVVD